MGLIHEDRLFPADPTTRAIARRLYETVKDLPIVSPHGHTDPRWFAENEPFPDPARLFVIPDHYVTRMLYSQGVRLQELGIATRDGSPTETDPRRIWRRFAENYHLFRGTPSRMWLDHSFATLFGLDTRLSAETADLYYDTIADHLARDDYRPRALFERFKIEVIATTESPLDPLHWHGMIRASGWSGQVITAYRPDPVCDPDFAGFHDNVRQLGELTGCDTGSWSGYLEAHRRRRAFFKSFGATSTDHGHPTARTADLARADAEALHARVMAGAVSAQDAELYRAQCLTEMAGMSLEDGLVMQIHPGSWRNHNPLLFDRFGRDMGADIPSRTDYVGALKPLLDRYGNEPALTVIVFTLDETTYSRELAPLAGHYPALRIGPAWWFFDSPEGMKRYRDLVTETAGFYNTVGFNDDTRAFTSIPARHDVSRRVDCGYLAGLVASHRLDEDEAFVVARDLAYDLARKAYKLD
ncbi:glucuronate isomerase [Prosthecodimorpha staleyi]|uniref:Uronate isomerase n=1 Tax=Prosthecodimorpha staleyi TaxID=2840188 RepID=A0A947DB77_9HYPH|nr:glucuronate isomerase [Prosthecodimorpha staleyi]MBT9292417.1 glucuronate isomerase [Prosthecodimorpha staleyi]